MTPNVNLTILDGSLGILPANDGDILAIVGAASAGPFNQPAAFARIADVKARHTSGPLVEFAAWIIGLTGKSVVICRSTVSTDPSETSLDVSGWSGTATPSINGSTEADDDYEAYIVVTAGGDLGSDGIKYQTSLDGGRTLLASAKLGFATSITIPTPAGLVKVDLAADTSGLSAAANDLRTKVLAHYAYVTGSVHLHADAVSGSGIGGASTDEPTAITLLNQIRTAEEAHRIDVGAGGSQVHLAADTVNVVTAPAATDAASAVVLERALRAQFVGHLASTVAHTIADATNGPTLPAVPVATLLAGDVLQFRTTAASWTSSDLLVSLDALRVTAQPWNIAAIVGACDRDAFELLDGYFEGLRSKNRFKYAIAAARIPNVGESDAEYQIAMFAEFGSVASPWVDLCAGSCKVISQVSGRSYRRPVNFPDAQRTISIDAGDDLAEVRKGPLTACGIVDANGNPDDHDEVNTPGLDDQRFTTLRTFEGRAGCFINNGRLFSAEGSDFKYVQARRVMNLACTALVFELVQNLSSKIIVDKSTGKISKGAAATLNDGGTTAMGNVLYPKQRASNCSYVVSTDDNILSTGIITGEARVTPQGYVKEFSTTIAFENPALKAAA